MPRKIEARKRRLLCSRILSSCPFASYPLIFFYPHFFSFFVFLFVPFPTPLPYDVRLPWPVSTLSRGQGKISLLSNRRTSYDTRIPPFLWWMLLEIDLWPGSIISHALVSFSFKTSASCTSFHGSTFWPHTASTSRGLCTPYSMHTRSFQPLFFFSFFLSLTLWCWWLMLR